MIYDINSSIYENIDNTESINNTKIKTINTPNSITILNCTNKKLISKKKFQKEGINLKFWTVHYLKRKLLAKK